MSVFAIIHILVAMGLSFVLESEGKIQERLESSSTFQPHNHDHITVKLIERYFPRGELCVLILSSSSSVHVAGIVNILHLNQSPVMIFRDTDLLQRLNKVSSLNKPAQSMVFWGTSAFVKSAVDVLSHHWVWNINAKMLVVLTEDALQPEQHIIRHVLQSFWYYFVANVVVFRNNFNETVNLYSAFPYRNNTGRCGATDIGFTPIGNYSLSHTTLDFELYPPKIPSKFNGCLRYTKVQIIRRDVKSLELEDDVSFYIHDVVSKYAGFKPYLMESSYTPQNSMVNNGSWEGVFGGLQRREVDILVGPYLLTDKRSYSFQATSVYDLFSYKVFVRCQIRAASMWNLGLLAALISVFTISSSLMYAMSYCHGGIHQLSPQDSAVQSWSVLMEVSVPRSLIFPSRSIIFVSLCIFSLFYNVTVKSTITAQNTSPGSASRMHSIKQLITESNLYIGTFSTILYEVLRDSVSDSESRQLASRIVDCTLNATECFQHFRNSSLTPNYAIACPEYELMGFLNESRTCYYTLEENLVISPAVYYMNKGDPFLSNLNFVIAQFWSTGITLNLMNQFEIKKDEVSREQNAAAVNEGLLRGAYTALILGWTVSGTVFGFEYLLGQIK